MRRTRRKQRASKTRKVRIVRKGGFSGARSRVGNTAFKVGKEFVKELSKDVAQRTIKKALKNDENKQNITSSIMNMKFPSANNNFSIIATPKTAVTARRTINTQRLPLLSKLR